MEKHPLPDTNTVSHDTLNLAKVLQVIADPVRLQLIAMLRAAPNQEACACNLVDGSGLTQPTISHHLKKIYGTLSVGPQPKTLTAVDIGVILSRTASGSDRRATLCMS